MSRTTLYPRPKKKYHRGTWEIYWNFDKRRYSIYPGRQDIKDPDIEVDFRSIAAALAMPSPVFPPPFDKAPAVVRYMKTRYGAVQEEKKEIPPVPTILAEYNQHLELHCAQNWAKTSKAIIKKLNAFVDGDILLTTPRQANRFLESLLAAKLRPSTRNRSLAACSRFFRWCQSNEYISEANPFHKIESLKEVTADEIVYCTKEERSRIIAIAANLNRPDWIAIPIALYAGCRREEIFNIQWEDINLETRRIRIRKSKTGKPRLTPIAQELLDILQPIDQERGPVVPLSKGETWMNQADRLVELIREHLSRPLNPNLNGVFREAIGKRRFVKKQADLVALPKQMEGLLKKIKKAIKDGQGQKALEESITLACLQGCPALARDGMEWIPAERLGWNAWRHTFATLRVQAGVSLDKVSSWMGNTYEICRRHYAQFVPRDTYDEDIDK